MSDKLFGFEELGKSLLDNFNQNQLHHGLLFSGIKGIGKTIFVNDLATKILLSSSTNYIDDLKKIQSHSHPDLLTIQKEEKKRDITVDIVREISQFLSLTSAISKHRIIIIDAIDDMNKNSNNAILKTLEEPPANVFLFLINHNPAKLIDTIKSRCRIIKINTPSYHNFKEILIKQIPEIDDQQINLLSKISDHSIGLALDMHHYNAIDLYEQIGLLITEGSQKEINDLAKTINSEEPLWEIFEKLITFYLYNLIKSKPRNKIFILKDKISNLFLATRNLNLDKSQTIINILNILKNAQ